LKKKLLLFLLPILLLATTDFDIIKNNTLKQIKEKQHILSKCIDNSKTYIMMIKCNKKTEKLNLSEQYLTLYKNNEKFLKLKKNLSLLIKINNNNIINCIVNSENSEQLKYCVKGYISEKK